MPLHVPTSQELAALRRETRQTDATAFAAVEEQVYFVVEALKTWSARRRLSKFEWLLLVHLGRATYTATHGILPVCEVAAGDLAMMHVRSLYETMISAYWMAIDAELRADAFDRFAALETRELHLLLVELRVLDAAELPAFDAAREGALRAEFPKPTLGWTKRKLWTLERDVEASWPEGSRHEFRLYAKAARNIGNRHSHVSAGETIARMAVNDGGAEVTIGPSTRARLSVPLTLKIAAWCYGQLVDLIVEHTRLTDLARSRACFQRAMLRTRTLSEEERRGIRTKDRCPCGSGWKFGRCHGQARTNTSTPAT